MKLFVGLGNPDKKYENTRHNVGFMVVDRIQAKYEINTWRDEKKYKALLCEISSLGVILVKPQTFMNESGVSVLKLASFYKIEANSIYIIHDDLDIKLGEHKIQKGVGPQLHYGVRSVEDRLGNKDFWRVRIGVDNRDSKDRIKGEDYVLQQFMGGEKEIIDQVIGNVLNDLFNTVIK